MAGARRVHPDKRTSQSSAVASALGQQQTHAVQQKDLCGDTSPATIQPWTVRTGARRIRAMTGGRKHSEIMPVMGFCDG
jgi:hypothetical protein